MEFKKCQLCAQHGMDRRELVIDGRSAVCVADLATARSVVHEAQRLGFIPQREVAGLLTQIETILLPPTLEYRDRQWSRELGVLAFPLFMGVVEMYLKRGESVIIDNPFVHVDDLVWFEKFVELYDTEIIQIHLIADPAVLRQRFIERANTHRHPGHNDALEEVLEEFDARWFNKSFIPLPIGEKTKIVDTTDFDAVDHDDILGWI